MSAVRSITVSGYKSIRDVNNFPLTPLNVLIGANGAGKSNFVSLFRLLAEIYDQHLQLHVQRQGGPDALLHFGRKVTERLSAELKFAKNLYAFSLVPTTDNRLVFEREQISLLGKSGAQQRTRDLGGSHQESALPRDQSNMSQFAQQSLRTWRVYHFHDTSDEARVKQRHASNDTLLLKPDAANLAPYLLMLKARHHDYYVRIIDTVTQVAPFFKDFVCRSDDLGYMELEWTQSGRPDTPLKAHLLSDGSLRFICLATLLLQPPGLLPDTIIIDEPELGLHPYAVAVLADILKQVTETKQVIVSTQSVELVNRLTPEDIVVVDQEEGASRFKRYTNAELADWLERYSLGELWNSNVLGGRP